MQQVEKRNGSVENFDVVKIKTALQKASVQAGISSQQVDGKIDEVCIAVEKEVSERFIDSYPNVENLHDIVEKCLMRAELFNVVRAYIVHRAEKDRLRKNNRTQHLNLKKLSLVKANGKTALFNPGRLRKKIEELAEGLSFVSAELLYEETTKNLYDAIKVADVSELILSSALSFIERDPEYDRFAARLFLGLLRQETLGSSEYDEDTYKDSFPTYIRSAVKLGLLDARLLEFDLEALAEALQPNLDGLFPFIGLKTLRERYFVKDGKKLKELPQYFWMRVAMGLSLLEKEKEQWAITFYGEMSNHRIVPSTPTLFHSGLPRPQLSSCYVLTVQDDLHDIFKTYSNSAQLSKYSGGIGIDWTYVRATLAPINSTKVESQGVIPFLKILDSTTVAINRSGKRRGATCVYIEPWHLDIFDFIDLKKETGDDRRRTHDLNTALWIPDLFMKRVEENGNWTLFSPDEVPDLHDAYSEEFEAKYVEYEARAASGEIKLHKVVKARDLDKRIISSLFSTGHPWKTFKDPANIRNPEKHVGVIHNTQLCTEVFENTSIDEVAVCNLSSQNLKAFIIDGVIDYKLLAKSCKIQGRMLDNVIDINFYPIPEAQKSNSLHRYVGAGVMGTQDLLFELGINFEDADDLIDQLHEFISFHLISASCDLAEEKGPYPCFSGSEWSKGNLPIHTYNKLCQRPHIQSVGHDVKLDWLSLSERVKVSGIRNSNIMAIAPTASISTIIGCYPSIEPQFSNLYVKSNMSGDFTIVNKYLVEDLKKLNLWNSDTLNSIKYYNGDLSQIEKIPQSLKIKYRGVFDVDQKALLRLSAIRQKYIDQGISHNIFYRGDSGKEVSDLYMYAWKMGLKSTYYLRTIGASQIEKATVTAPLACSINNPECESCQ